MVIQVERFLSGQKCTRVCWSLTDHELVLAEKSKELGACWRKGTSNSDWKNAGICSCLAMFVHVLLSPGGISPSCPGALCPWLSPEDQSAALPCRCAQLCSPCISHDWGLTGALSPLCLTFTPSCSQLSVPLFLGFTSSCCLSCLSGTETQTAAPWAGAGRAGQHWQNLGTVFSSEWCQHMFGLNFSLNSASKSTQSANWRVQTAQSRDHHSLCLYSSRYKANALSLMKVSTCSCTINNNLNIVCLSSSGWAWSDHFGKMEQLSSKNTYLKNYSGRSETYKLINELKLWWRLWWEEKIQLSEGRKLKESKNCSKTFIV